MINRRRAKKDNTVGASDAPIASQMKKKGKNSDVPHVFEDNGQSSEDKPPEEDSNDEPVGEPSQSKGKSESQPTKVTKLPTLRIPK